MGYIQDLEAEVRRALHGGADEDTIVKLFKDKVWESYKNGQKEGRGSKKKSGPYAPKD